MYIKVIGQDMNQFQGKDIILFGSGSCGMRALEEFEKAGANIIGFCDNNKDLSGKKINDYEIYSPDRLYDFPNASIIITSTYDKEIEEQLESMKLNRYYHVKVGVLKETLPINQFRNKVLSIQEANQCIYDGLKGTDPFFVGRLGSVELECLSHYLYFLDRKTFPAMEYPGNVKMMTNVNAGFFPPEDSLLDRFSALYLKDMNTMDLIWSMWFSKYEDMIYQDYYVNKCVAEYDSLAFPINIKDPWTKALEGKKVLIIHPFEASIQKNYQIMDKLFSNGFIPDFELITLKAVQSIANNKTVYATWFDALDDMKNKISTMDFDIALIGAGAYGLPLGAYIKSIGKKAMHIGGMLQLFFGIKGKAWNKLNIYNEYWTSPLEDETPAGFKNVEAGRYW